VKTCSSRWLSLLLLAAFLAAAVQPVSVQAAEEFQGSDPRRKAETLLARLSPEERVGQLFLVTFKGMDVRENSQIYDLLVNRHVGGVILSADNNNFIGPENTLNNTHTLISTLQTHRWVFDTGGAAPDATTSSGVRGSPLWNFTPWRSTYVYVLKSSLMVKDSASSGLML
jgi:hypothetical protein